MKQLKLTVITCIILFWTTLAIGQSYAFGLKGGPTIGIQKWDGFDQNPLLKYHGIAFIESAPQNNQFAIFAQAGYHMKGSTQGGGTTTGFLSGKPIRIPIREFIFENISLMLGGKQKYNIWGGNSRVYYMAGFRGEYTVNTNLDEYDNINESFNTLFFPTDFYVQKFNYGVTLGGGIELPFSEFVAGIAEFTINPDFSRQYNQPPIQNVRNPYTGQNTTLSAREIRNITFEITIGIRFLHRIEYID